MENLKYLLYKGNLTTYQRALAQREFEGLIERLELFENYLKKTQPEVDGSKELRISYAYFSNSAKNVINIEPLDKFTQVSISKSELPTLISWLRKQL